MSSRDDSNNVPMNYGSYATFIIPRHTFKASVTVLVAWTRRDLASHPAESTEGARCTWP
jgi:hypothetical protein